jgi:hypothetical protein
MDYRVTTALKRQIPFLVGGTVTGVIMTYYMGFLVTILVNSLIWYIISYVVYKFVWKKNSLTDQRMLLNYFRNKVRSKKYANH